MMMKWDLAGKINKSTGPERGGADGHRVNGVEGQKCGFVYMFPTNPRVCERERLTERGRVSWSCSRTDLDGVDEKLSVNRITNAV